MSVYRDVVLPKICDLSMRNKRLKPYRERVIGAAEGRVLEIGAGSGLNLKLYKVGVSEVIALDPDPALLRIAKAKQASRPVSYIEASAEEIPLDDKSVDTVVTTWTLCSIPDVARALQDMRRVLKPGGRLLFVEHGLASEQNVRKWQNRLTPLWVRISGGCHLNRPIANMVEGAAFRLEKLETGYMSGPKIFTFLSEGSAKPI